MINLKNVFSGWEIFSIAANMASILGLIFAITGSSNINPNVFIILIAITLLIIVLLITFKRDDRIRALITADMDRRFTALIKGDEYIEGLKEKIQDLEDKVELLEHSINGDDNEERRINPQDYHLV
jgi:hypothetical protein